MKIRAAVLETLGLPAPYAQSRPLKIREVEIDPPGHGEVRVRVLAAGLCHSWTCRSSTVTARARFRWCWVTSRPGK